MQGFLVRSDVWFPSWKIWTGFWFSFRRESRNSSFDIFWPWSFPKAKLLILFLSLFWPTKKSKKNQTLIWCRQMVQNYKRHSSTFFFLDSQNTKSFAFFTVICSYLLLFAIGAPFFGSTLPFPLCLFITSIALDWFLLSNYSFYVSGLICLYFLYIMMLLYIKYNIFLRSN